MVDRNDITNDAYNILCVIYRVYLQRRRDGLSKTTAIEFSDYELFRQEHLPKYDKSDFADLIFELKNNELVKLYVDGGFDLTNNAVILMENRFKNRLSDVIEFVSKFIGMFL